MNKNFAVFESSWPDDSHEDANGDIIVPAGKGLVEAIHSKLGSYAASPYLQHSFYGWKFDIELGPEKRAGILLQHPDHWLLIVEVKSRWLEREATKQAIQREAVASVNTALLKVAEVSNVTWMSQEEFSQLQRAKQLRK